MEQLDYCKLEDVEIEFRLFKPIAKTSPKVDSIKINLHHAISTDPSIDASNQDPINNYKFDMMVTGFSESQNFVNCWHLDCDRFYDDDGKVIEMTGVQKFTHPLYHFQFGGDKMGIQNSGEILLLAAPRIPHPPMDIFLSIHFILKNFYSAKETAYSFIQDLYSDDDYKLIIDRAKQRMWAPYFKGLSSDDNKHQDFNMSKLFPLAVHD
ncbi:hypothetical protein B5G52_21545 [Pseudoalteromonas sp. A601]|nr:hypothetical protein B5G52_21545 [Pseudoalteromonas sp. A601]